MALPKEPRQKMIQMMYLVLTAMLALNVSAEILNAFKIVDQSITRSSDLIKDKSDQDMKKFDAAAQEQGEEKVKQFRDNAKKAAAISGDVYDYVESLKDKIFTDSHGDKATGHFVESDLDAPTRIMDNQKNGIALKAKLEDLRTQLLMLVNPSAKEEFERTLPLKIVIPKVENKGNRDWVGAHFRMVPSVAAMTILSKFQNDIRSSANAIIEYNLSQISAQTYKFDKFEPYISSNSTYLMSGQQFQATIGVGAFSSSVKPEITVNGSPLSVTDGKGTFSEMAAGAGTHTLNVVIKMPKPGGAGGFDVTTKQIEYNVGSSTLSVSADLTKVVFRGIPNPISVSGGGVTAEDLIVNVSNGTSTSKGGGKYEIKPGDGNECIVTVSAKQPGGAVKQLGVDKFKVKDIPYPTAYVGNASGGRMSSAFFKANQGLRAVLENFDFVSGLNYTVTSFKVYAVGGNIPQLMQGSSSSYSFAPISNIIKMCSPGTSVSFEDIKAVGPDGKTRSLKGITFQLTAGN